MLAAAPDPQATSAHVYTAARPGRAARVIGKGDRVVAEAGGAVRLREVGTADAAALYRWRMEPSARAMFRDAGVVPFARHRALVADYLRPECTDQWFVVEAEGCPVGAIALYRFSADGTEAEWGRFVIAPEHRGRGWGRRALSLLLEYARTLGVRRLRCRVAADNPPADALYRSLGFADDGVERIGERRFRRLIASL